MLTKRKIVNYFKEQIADLHTEIEELKKQDQLNKQKLFDYLYPEGTLMYGHGRDERGDRVYKLYFVRHGYCGLSKIEIPIGPVYYVHTALGLDHKFSMELDDSFVNLYVSGKPKNSYFSVDLLKGTAQRTKDNSFPVDFDKLRTCEDMDEWFPNKE